MFYRNLEIIKLNVSKITEKFYYNMSKSNLSTGVDHKHNLLKNEHATKQFNKLERTKHQVLDLEMGGAAMVNELKNQTDQMREIHGNLDEVDKEVDFSRKLIETMLRRENRNKIMIYMAVCLILLMIVSFTFFN